MSTQPQIINDAIKRLAKKSGYVIRKLGDELEPDPYVFLAGGKLKEDGWHEVDRLEQCLTFGSRLSAERWMETHGIDLSMYKPVLRAGVPLKPDEFKTDDLPFNLNITDPLEAVNKTVELHEHYCGRIEQWLRNAGVPKIHDGSRPTPVATVLAPKWAGLYSPTTNACHYPVVYAMIAKDWHVVVAHECVHAYQDHFTGRGAGHGNDFYALMAHAAKEPVTKHTHDYPVGEACRLARKLRPWWAEQRQRGILASLPMEVIEVKTKRRGLR